MRPGRHRPLARSQKVGSLLLPPELPLRIINRRRLIVLKSFCSRTDNSVRMPLDALLWMLLPAIVAAGSSLLTYYIMQARLDVAVAHERETLAEVRGEV